MSKQIKTGKKSGNQNIKVSRDVTIYDFANSPQSISRPKKSEGSITNIVKNELLVKEHWDIDADEVEKIDADGAEEIVDGSTKCRKKEKIIKKDAESGVDYPIDIWFLISEFISPECVGKFALICPTSHAVTQSVQFWKSLYKRYYNKQNMKPEFQPECLLRHFGLRPAVIRALFLMYPPFRSRIRLGLTKKTHPHSLIGMTCVGINTSGFTCRSKTTQYYFKFQRNVPQLISCTMCCTKSKEQSVMELLNDINANPDEDHLILYALSSEHKYFEGILGRTLKNASIKLSEGCCSNRLTLTFGHAFSVCSPTTITLDDVSSISILNWWHPMFIKSTRGPLSDEW